MKHIISIIACLLLHSTYYSQQAVSDSLMKYIQLNPKKCAYFVIKNNSQLAAHNAANIVPIGNASHYLVALEFAKQATYKVIDTAELVPLKDIVKYYLPSTTIDHYDDWFAQLLLQKKIVNNSVTLLQVVHGMLEYDVVANAEYLMDRLGFDNIKSSIQSYNLTGHTSILPPVGAIALFQNRNHTTEKKILKEINNMSEEGYCKLAFMMHNAIKNDSTFKQKMPNKMVTNKVLNKYYNRLPQGSTKAYATLLQTILDEAMLDAKYYKMLRVVLEPNKGMYNSLERIAAYTSYTSNSATYVGYSKAYTGNQAISIALSLYNLTAAELSNIQRWLVPFSIAVRENDIVQKQLQYLKIK